MPQPLHRGAHIYSCFASFCQKHTVQSRAKIRKSLIFTFMMSGLVCIDSLTTPILCPAMVPLSGDEDQSGESLLFVLQMLQNNHTLLIVTKILTVDSEFWEKSHHSECKLSILTLILELRSEFNCLKDRIMTLISEMGRKWLWSQKKVVKLSQKFPQDCKPSPPR